MAEGSDASARHLDALLDKAATRELAEGLLGLAPTARIRWLRKAVGEGASSVLAAPLVRTLMEQARLREEKEPGSGADFVADAARYGLFGYIAMRSRAPLCSDVTSPDEYLHELGVVLAPLLGRLAALDRASRRRIVDEALALDDQIRPFASRDTLLCRRGQFGDRFCPSGTSPEDCPDNAAPFAEFITSSELIEPRLRARSRARGEVLALGR
ncbi:MAG: hypothetical protein U1E62_09685 [Alsobacter sp.]